MSENNDETKTAPKTHKMLKPAQAIVLRVFAGSSDALTYDQVEAAVGLTGKTGLYSALGGMWNKGVIAHVGGPAPEMSAARVPQAAYDRKETKFQIVSADLRAMLAMLGLAG